MLLSFVPVLYTAVAAGTRIRYQDISPGTCIPARARVPSPSPRRSSVGPEPEPSSLDSEIDDTLSLAEFPRAPEHASVSLGCIAFSGTYSRGIPGTCTYFEAGVILRAVVLVSYSIIIVVVFHIYQRYVKCWNVSV